MDMIVFISTDLCDKMYNMWWITIRSSTFEIDQSRSVYISEIEYDSSCSLIMESDIEVFYSL